MQKTTRSGTIVSTGSILVAFAAIMLAMWSFAHVRPVWGAYNLAIALVALAVIVATRARAHDG